MSYRIEFFGHCCEDKHDKIWGYAIVQDEEVYSFWGARGKSLAFKRHGRQGRWDVEQKAREKARHGRRSGYYRPVPVWGDNTHIEAVWPGFIKEFENQLFLAKMSDQFRVDELAET